MSASDDTTTAALAETPLTFRPPGAQKAAFTDRCARLGIDQAAILRAALDHAMQQSDRAWIHAAHGTPFKIKP